MSDHGEKGIISAALEGKAPSGSSVINGSSEPVMDAPPPLTAEEQRLEKRLLWKMDLTILPLITLTYFLSSMARADLANAKTAGLVRDLGITAKQYANLSSIFLVGYIVFQIPGTILVRKIGPPRQFALAMTMWGIFTVCHVRATNYSTMMGLRFLVGGAEAFLEGGVFYMSFWYTYTELCRRGAIFYSAAALAGSFNGLIAYGIEKNLAGAHGWTAWQWLFLVEGVLPIGCAVIILVLLPPTPEQGHFIFSKAERALAIRRSRRAFNPVDAQIRPKLMIQPLLSPFFWGLALVYMCNHFALSSLTNFLPSIIQGFGFSSVKAQLWSVIVYACALVGTNVFAWIADKTDRRGLPLIGASSFALVGYIMLMAITNNSGRFAGTCILCFGLFATIPISTSWITLTVAGYTQRATSVAAINMISQAFSIAGNQAYIDPPLYRKGLAASLGVTAAHIVVMLGMLLLVRYTNAKKDKYRRELSPEALAQEQAASWDLLGDKHINFRYND